MFDKQKIIAMMTLLEEFVRVQPNIFIMPESWSWNVIPLLKRLNANVAGILTNAPVNSEQKFIQTPSGNYPLINSQEILSKLNFQTGVIISSAKSVPNPNVATTLSIGEIKISIPAFVITDEEAMAIYDRIATLETLKRYKDDGIINGEINDISIRFARGMSTLIDSRYQDVKVQVWDRRVFINPGYEVDDAAIVIQGPIEYKDNYTITTAQLYRQWYPNAPIIISTWKNEPTDEFREECKKIGVVLLENELPERVGDTVNYQLESSRQGVEYAKKNTSVKFALKCRTDQRINRSDFLMYFKNLLKAFPPNGDKINERIIIMESDRWTPFFICDFLYFGEITDMYKLFNIPRRISKDEPPLRSYGRNKFHPIRAKLIKFRLFQNFSTAPSRKLRNYNVAISKFIPAETFIMKNFYNINIAPVEPSKFLQTYWKFLRDYLIVVDDNAILFEWLKYHFWAHAITSYYNGIRACIGIDHARWLDIYLNHKDEDD